METETRLGRAIIHIHTRVRDGRIAPERCPWLAVERGQDAIVITDHDTVGGALRAVEEAEKWGIEVSVVPGDEVTTAQGHVLGLDLRKEIETMRSLLWTVRKIHGEGGLVVIPHVGRPLSISPGAIDRLYQAGEKVDGIEVFNPYYTLQDIKRAEALCAKYGATPLPGDDDHFGNFGKLGARLLFLGKTRQDLLLGIKNGTVVIERFTPFPDPVSMGDKISQAVNGLVAGFPQKLKRAPVLISTLVDLRRGGI